MDLSFISGIASGLSTALDLGRSAVDARDESKLAVAMVAMNEKLLDAQQCLIAHNTELLVLQQQYFQCAQQLREAEEALAERRRYALFDIGGRQFAYRADARPAGAGPGDPCAPEPEHFICQQCFDGPTKSKVVLAHFAGGNGSSASWCCPACRSEMCYGPSIGTYAF